MALRRKCWIFTGSSNIIGLRGEKMIKTTAMLLDELKAYSNPKDKISRMAREGKLFPISKGLYETDRSTPAFLLAGSIYGPSYISFESALADCGLIPEAVYAVTCATFEKKKKKTYTTPFGTFTYRDVPSAAFPLALRLMRQGDYFYRIAAPEKALCDKLYTLPPAANADALTSLLFDDLRIDETDLRELSLETIAALAPHYHSTNVKKLVSFLRKARK